MQPSDWSDVRKQKYGHMSESASQYQEPADIQELGARMLLPLGSLPQTFCVLLQHPPPLQVQPSPHLSAMDHLVSAPH